MRQLQQSDESVDETKGEDDERQQAALSEASETKRLETVATGAIVVRAPTMVASGVKLSGDHRLASPSAAKAAAALSWKGRLDQTPGGNGIKLQQNEQKARAKQIKCRPRGTGRSAFSEAPESADERRKRQKLNQRIGQINIRRAAAEQKAANQRPCAKKKQGAQAKLSTFL